jgi:hypothetical protein
MRFVQLAVLVVGVLGLATLMRVAYASQGVAARSPQMLEQLLRQLDDATASGVALGDPSLRALREQIDHVAGQKDAHLSRLYWYTDLNQALSEARRTNRPLLSLRLLGRLDEELSCANSRFFRAILYADPQISKLLRERFVLHWESVRDVPVATIDFGNGRKLTRTITGNSIHYILSPDGAVVDALPGLIAPRVFERELTQIAKLSSWEPEAIREYQQRAMKRLATEQFADADLALPATTLSRISASVPRPPPRFVTAERAATRAMSKSGIERPLLRQVRNPMPALADDTRMNMTQLRPKILSWLIESPAKDLTSLNGRVYAELFLTPLDDPWMGLDAPDVFSGLPSEQ